MHILLGRALNAREQMSLLQQKINHIKHGFTNFIVYVNNKVQEQFIQMNSNIFTLKCYFGLRKKPSEQFSGNHTAVHVNQQPKHSLLHSNQSKNGLTHMNRNCFIHFTLQM